MVGMETKDELIDRLIEQAERAGELKTAETAASPVKITEEAEPEDMKEPEEQEAVAQEASAKDTKEPEQPEETPKEPEVQEEIPKEPEEPGDTPTKRVRIKRDEDPNRALKNAIHSEIHAEVVKSYQNTESAIRESSEALSKSMEEAVRESAEASRQRLEAFAEETDEKLKESASSTGEKLEALEERQKASEELQKGNRQWLFLLLILLILNFVISAVLLFR
ncbi:MAG: hypothetical protein K5985_07050 [Lachnospiraceae bacterium]|nr:hypothetical protein [Lachnospiraceae bacterium]